MYFLVCFDRKKIDLVVTRKEPFRVFLANNARRTNNMNVFHDYVILMLIKIVYMKTDISILIKIFNILQAFQSIYYLTEN